MANRIQSRSHFVGRRSPGRLTEWFGSADSTGVAALAAASFTLNQSLTAVELAKRPFTVTRTVGSIWVSSDQVAAPEVPFGALGFIVVSEKASATGVTAVPDPITQEASDDWFVYQSILGFGDATVQRPMTEYKFDSRGQRKVEDGQDIVIMIANASSTDGMFFIVKFRMLVKLS